MMLIRLDVEKRPAGWQVDVRDVPGAGSLAPTREAALAETFRKLADKAERRELMSAYDVFIAEAPPAGQKAFTGADLLALWKRLPHPGAEWADAVEKATGSQASILDEPAPWEP
jgi:hypothetical protein